VECSRSNGPTDQYEESMIKNIIFDLGNVLISFKPGDFLEKKGYSSETRNIILNDIFKSPEWLGLDNGTITTAEAIEKISVRSSLKWEEIASIFKLRIEIMYPLHGNIKLLPGLKKRGFKLYFLSNFPDDIFDEVFREYDFFKFFDGGIISSRVKCSKPDFRIFEILMEKYSLSRSECLFIDDIEINTNAAQNFGVKSFCTFGSSDISKQLEEKLVE
jgi:putative hydrolase of the HAD superfamily